MPTHPASTPVLNISTYKFVPLPDTASLQPTILEALKIHGIKGTVLLAEEGINMFLAAASAEIHGFLDWLRQDARFADLQAKESWSAVQPFHKLLVKIKPEIIRMNHPAIRPSAGRAPAVAPATLKRWLDAGHDDAGRPVVTLDTRNTYEVDAGTFKDTIDWRLEKFTEFPQAVHDHRDDLAGKTVVSFCTGGIRCEKAAIYLQEAGIEHVYQLEGGILKYFEECGSAHYEGDCFVFDDRRAVDAALQPKVDAPGLPRLAQRFVQVRHQTEHLTAPLSPEDCQLQSMPDASPAKWHLAHVTWFFETFVLEKFEARFTPFDASFRVLFNSYYKGIGDQYPRPQRGLISRPSLAQVLAYRAQVDERVLALLVSPDLRGNAELAQLITLGLQHEQQHQELLLTDIKHALSFNPLHPAYEASAQPAGSAPAQPLRWLHHDDGLVQHGFDATQDGSFSFDNETPRHTVYIAPFELASRPLTNGEVMAFIADGGYRQPGFWLSMGWDWVNASQRDKPLYWQGEAGDYRHFTLQGLVKVDPNATACHLSYFEADALARWSGARLPTEFEWELAARALPAPLPGEVWEWTQSSYSAYPGYAPCVGPVGEYNGKFMCQQFVLRGGSCATPPSHIRASYRNFFPPEAQWQFSGLRLARDAQGARSNTSTSAA